MSATITAEVEQLEARLASEVAEGALLADIEPVLARLRRAYRADKSRFDDTLIARLQRIAYLAEGLRLFVALIDRRGDICDLTTYLAADGEFELLVGMFAGLPVRVRIEREWEGLRALRPQVELLEGKTLAEPKAATARSPTPDLFTL